MPEFSQRSKDNLATCDVRLQAIFNKVVEEVDCVILEGFRNEADQEKAFEHDKSTKHWPDSKHNRQPSKAVDALPYPVDWSDTKRMTLFAGYVLATAAAMGHKLRWGGDWNRNFQVNDEKFHDLPHFEIVEEI